MEQLSVSSTLITESPPVTASQLEHMLPLMTPLPAFQIGENESNQLLNPLGTLSQSKSETNFAKLSSSLKSHVKPHVLLWQSAPPEVRILRVSKEDIKQLCQVVAEFQEQFIG
jgi:hypothetical protein